MSDAISGAADDLRRQLEAKVSAIKESQQMTDLLALHQALNALEGVLKQQKTSLSSLFGLEGPAEGSEAIPVRFDEFFALAPLVAAKRFLKKCPDARVFEEIVDAIKRGGGKVDSEEDLRTGLTRSTYDVVRIGPDRFGLLEKYEHVRRGKKKKGVSEIQDAVIQQEEEAQEIHDTKAILDKGADDHE